MKTLLSTFKIAMLFTIISIVTTVYASSGHKHTEEGKDCHHEHGESGHADGHMGHMNDVREKLKNELGDKYNQPVPAATKEQLVLGKTIFTKSCVACHGENGKGNGPAAAALKQKPADFTDPEHSKFYSDQGRMHIIKKGIKNTPMSGWENVFSENEIQSLHAYVRSLRSTENEEKQKHGHGDHDH
ncbi:MAG: hypothetical protein BMS9Abin06_0461 [Gammaproteobacteria bacterium]|nr:MAG: hypothetical protein BMS9Abin06_0461 [Gammaproteobacteria bacterium]